MEINIVFPHQLFEKSIFLKNGYKTYMLEEYLFFSQYTFHKIKIAYHRASMKFYEQHLLSKGIVVEYIEAKDAKSDIRKFIQFLSKEGVTKIHYYDPVDDWLSRRVSECAVKYKIELSKLDSPMFLNTAEDLSTFFKPDKKSYFQTKFYIEQRKKRNILLDKDNKAIGGKWSYDHDNRKKYPRKKVPPKCIFQKLDSNYKEAIEYTEKNFKKAYGEISEDNLYPYNFKDSRKWLKDFFISRFEEFGPYEDAIVAEENVLNHSVLTPMLNTGLLTPQYIIDQSLRFAEEHEIPLNSVEGFVRQIIGWREFIRGIYEVQGRVQRTKNYWNFERKIPASFYDGSTGIEPVDNAIQKVLKTGYCHHIERLMILGNFMLLCEFDPDEVYVWFMELFIDAYDWVMVPNVYGMSQFSDGGMLATKPYISGSNYVIKMSNFKKGKWSEIWDGLFWRYMHVHRDFFLSNPRISMLVRMFDKMPEEKQSRHLEIAENYLQTLP